MKDAILRKARESAAVKEAFFRVEAERIEALARAMATAFERGGRLYVMGNGGGATDAQHVAVEFGHPILEKRRPLPALALTTDTALLTAISNDRDFAKVFGDQLRLLGRQHELHVPLGATSADVEIIHTAHRRRRLDDASVAHVDRHM